MDQWDEDRQDWTEPDRPEGPPPGAKSARVAVVAALAVALCVAVGAGVWAWMPDGEAGSSGSGAPAQAGPTAPDTSAAAPGETGGSGTSHGVPTEPCAAVSDGLAAELSLQRPVADESGCRWRWTKDDLTSFRLSYSDEPPAQWEDVSPIEVDGVPSATKYSNAMTCMVMWPTSYGSVNLSAGSAAISEKDLCDLAAEFAAGVAPQIPR
jgi:hypothetical protein